MPYTRSSSPPAPHIIGTDTVLHRLDSTDANITCNGTSISQDRTASRPATDVTLAEYTLYSGFGCGDDCFVHAMCLATQAQSGLRMEVPRRVLIYAVVGHDAGELFFVGLAGLLDLWS